jgi:TolA-binding protein
LFFVGRHCLPSLIDTGASYQSIIIPKLQVPAATAKFASAQTFLGYTQAKDRVVSSPNTNSEVEDSKIEELESQLQQIAQEIASLKKQKLGYSPQEVRSEMEQKNNKFQSY